LPYGSRRPDGDYVRADAGTGGTVRISIYGRHSTNKDFLVSRNKEDRTVFDPNLFCRAAWNSFLITTDGLSAHTAIVVRHGERPPQRGDSMGRLKMRDLVLNYTGIFGLIL